MTPFPSDKAAYSKHYSHTPANSQTSVRPKAKKDELEMFLTRLIVGTSCSIKVTDHLYPFCNLIMNAFAILSEGKEVDLKQDRTLTVPPIDPSTGYKYNQKRYNSVTGVTAGSQVRTM